MDRASTHQARPAVAHAPLARATSEACGRVLAACTLCYLPTAIAHCLKLNVARVHAIAVIRLSGHMS